MSDSKQILENEGTSKPIRDAIRQVIAEAGAVDYIDVVQAVRNKYRFDVTTAQVEEVYHQLDNETRQQPQARTSVSITAMPIASKPESLSTNENEAPEITLPHCADSTPMPGPQDDLSKALCFVKSVGGLAAAKRALLDLESVLLGNP